MRRSAQMVKEPCSGRVGLRVRVLAKRLGLTIYGTADTLRAAELPDSASVQVIRSGEEFTVAGFEIKPFSKLQLFHKLDKHR